MTLLERDRENREEGQLQQLYALLLKGRLTFEEAYEEVQEILTLEEFEERLEELSSGK